ncbi:MAG: biopolymer transporter ExbD [Kiritimatiellae bacterium]|nr:biopolymer transporter ExbD [Kiritimatiellia bacterium]
MKFAPKKRARVPGISMTSMLDVIFLLLFYFAAMSVKAQWEYDFDLKLPSSKATTDSSRQIGELILNVNADGVLTVNDVKRDLDWLADTLGKLAKDEMTVVIRADKDLRYEKLLAVIEVCRNCGVWNFALPAIPAGQEGVQ